MNCVNKLTLLTISFLMLLSTSMAHATVIGDSVDMARVWGASNLDAQSSIVGAGIEWTNSNHYNADISEGSISIDFSRNVGFTPQNNGLTQHLLFSGFDFGNAPGAAFTSAQLVSFTSDIAGGAFDSNFSDNLSFGSNWIRLNIGGWQFTSNSFVNISFSTTEDGNVPTPAPLALLGIGMLVLGYSRKRKTT